MTRVEELKERIIDMIDLGLTRFGFTTGPDWSGLTIEEKADAILTMWDAPKLGDGAPTKSNQAPMNVADFVAQIQRDSLKA